MAGAAAAGALAQANVSNFVLLEAKNYIGGRVHSEPFGVAEAQGFVELGANWVHGTQDKPGNSQNPIDRLATRVGLARTLIPGSCANLSGYGMYNANGEIVADAGARVARFMSAWNCVNMSAEVMPDRSFRDALKACGWSMQGKIDELLEWEVGPANDILASNIQSVKMMYPDPTYDVLGPNDFFTHDQHPRGYAAVVDQVLTDAGMAPQDPRLHLNTEVVSVAINDDDTVTARSTDGRTFRGRFAVVALPLGVMQSRHSSMLTSPPLSRVQEKALNSYVMGNFTKIFAQWPHRFWAARGMQWLAADNSSDAFGMPKEFHDLGAMIPGFNVLFTYVVGEDASAWEAMSDTEAAKQLTRRLQDLFPDITVPHPVAFKMTRHGSDPFMLGAYTTAPVGVDAMEAMSSPLRAPGNNGRKIFFAGEHTCENFVGYLQGAYESGLRAAAGALEEMGQTAVLQSRC